MNVRVKELKIKKKILKVSTVLQNSKQWNLNLQYPLDLILVIAKFHLHLSKYTMF